MRALAIRHMKWVFLQPGGVRRVERRVALRQREGPVPGQGLARLDRGSASASAVNPFTG